MNQKSTRSFSGIDTMSTEELESILRDDFMMDNNESDMELILYIMEVLEKRKLNDLNEEIPDVDAAWEDFNAYYRPVVGEETSLLDFEDGESEIPRQSSPKIRRINHKALRRVILVAATLAVLLLAGTLTASALGYDLWGLVATWTNETFGFTTHAATSYAAEEYDPEYLDLLEAVREKGITQNVVPKYLPDGYAIEELYSSDEAGTINVVGVYKLDEQVIIIHYSNQHDGRLYQKDDGDPTIILLSGIEHYIMNNSGYFLAAWVNGSIEGSVTGTISETELYRILNSIYS